MEKIDRIIAVLDREFPDPQTELIHSSPLELLIATILSAQCTDKRVNQVTAGLFKKYRTARDYAQADPKAFAQEIRSTGFYKSKTKNIIGCARELVKRFGGRVPETMDELITLPGVWRKTASVILGNCFNTPAVVVDTHVRRVSQRLGLTKSDDPDEIEIHLAEAVPKKLWTRVSHQLLLHGRHICKARAPLCSECDLKPVCPFYQSQGRPSRNGGKKRAVNS